MKQSLVIKSFMMSVLFFISVTTKKRGPNLAKLPGKVEEANDLFVDMSNGPIQNEDHGKKEEKDISGHGSTHFASTSKRTANKRCCCEGPCAGAACWDYGEPFGLGGLWGPGYGLGGYEPSVWDYNGVFGGWNGWSYPNRNSGTPSEDYRGGEWQRKYNPVCFPVSLIN